MSISVNNESSYDRVNNKIIGGNITDRAILSYFKNDNKKIKLDILFKTGESINTYSDNLGKKFHSLDYVTTNNCGICYYKWWNII